MDDSARLKRLDRILGEPLLALLGAWDSILRLVAPARARRGGELSGIRRIAVVKTVAIGDLVVALPTLRALRSRFPEAHITLITTPRVRQVVEGCPDVDDILYYGVFDAHRGFAGFARFARVVRARRFDAWVELEHYYRFTTLLGYISGARVRAGFHIGGQRRGRLFTIRVPYPVQAHEAEAFYAVARALGAEEPFAGLVPVPTSERDEAAVDAWLARNGLDGQSAMAILHTTTSPVAVARRWVDDRWVELADALSERCGLLPVFTGAPEDALPLRALASRTRGPAIVAAGDIDLKQFAVLASRARLVVSLDTGPLHVAAATGTPTVGLFGPNTPEKWGPYGSGNAAVWAELPCAPCTKQYLGQVTSCDRDDCMRAISVGDVLDAIGSLPARPCPPVSVSR